MNKLLSFTTGLFCGAAVGAVIALLITPASGEDLMAQMQSRWQEALAESKRAQEETKKHLEETYLQQRS